MTQTTSSIPIPEMDAFTAKVARLSKLAVELTTLAIEVQKLAGVVAAQIEAALADEAPDHVWVTGTPLTPDDLEAKFPPGSGDTQTCQDANDQARRVPNEFLQEKRRLVVLKPSPSTTTTIHGEKSRNGTKSLTLSPNFTLALCNHYMCRQLTRVQRKTKITGYPTPRNSKYINIGTVLDISWDSQSKNRKESPMRKLGKADAVVQKKHMLHHAISYSSFQVGSSFYLPLSLRDWLARSQNSKIKTKYDSRICTRTWGAALTAMLCAAASKTRSLYAWLGHMPETPMIFTISST
ncbi:hypothetical protein C8J57DRAFT_1259583 [Mycena rebaudengoi]|nr:hypothetical protein C8J57DRAFT_1259583 [Mycena rebaudengoi]